MACGVELDDIAISAGYEDVDGLRSGFRRPGGGLLGDVCDEGGRAVGE
jgi:hypothetical protein